jgi:hypothetical protein
MQTLERETSGDLSKAPIQASILQHIPIAAAIFFMLLNLNGIMAPVVITCYACDCAYSVTAFLRSNGLKTNT